LQPHLLSRSRAVTSYKRRHHGDSSSALQCILKRRAPIMLVRNLDPPEGPKNEAAGRVEARSVENWGRRPILWQRSSGQGALRSLSSCKLYL